ncbi:PepSY domain-containing protein [Opitutia bacterium ISCC 51]|nr:PepSY domain-containing protein [Opitutae bacterium ISCC 51]QXD29865.1 PepSY domain-containing protein [Opitutae bacterium ISCC 52]
MDPTNKHLTTEGSQKNRSIWFHLHFWIGWIAAIPIALICLTGGILIFEQEIFQLEQKELFQLEVTEDPLSVAEVIDAYRTADPPLRVNHLGIPRSPEHAYSAYTSGGRVFLNPYTGELIRLNDGFSISHLMIDIHRHLAAGKIGQQLAAISSLILALTCIIGLVLWWPLRGRTFVRAWKRGQALDWHNALGLVALVPLIIMGITGLTFT